MNDEFLEYCWSFYRPHEIYGHFFDHGLTRDELRLAIELRRASAKYSPVQFDGDSVDREAVRDILLFARNKAHSAVTRVTPI